MRGGYHSIALPSTNGHYVSLAVPAIPEVRRREVAKPFAREKQHVAFDLRVLEWLRRTGIWLARNYLRGRSFAIAHYRGLVPQLVRQSRWKECVNCPSLYRREGHPYCKASCGCGCGEYSLSRLTWRLRLANWACPMGRFGKHGR